jgi:hypothetical protein
MTKAIILTFAFIVAGCTNPAPSVQYQRFVLVPDPTHIGKNIPPGALALDTKTGQLCYTVGGSFTDDLPKMDMCYEIYKTF